MKAIGKAFFALRIIPRLQNSSYRHQPKWKKERQKTLKNIQRSLQVSKLRQYRIVLLLHKLWQINTFQKSLKSRQWRKMVRLSRQTIPRLYSSITEKCLYKSTWVYTENSLHIYMTTHKIRKRCLIDRTVPFLIICRVSIKLHTTI